MFAAAATVFWGSLGCARSVAPPPPDVVLVVLDAAAPAHFGLYGSSRKTTPAIDRLAEDSVVWDRAYAQAPSTLPSIASLLTGRYPSQTWKNLNLDGVSLAEHLAAAGYHTLAFVENPWLVPGFGFDRGFDVFWRRPDRDPKGGGGLPDSSTVQRALSALDAGGGKPAFLYLHLLPPHSPYSPPPEFRGRFIEEDNTLQGDGYVAMALGQVKWQDRLEEVRSAVLGERRLTDADRFTLLARYDENLAWADAQVAELLRGLDERGRLGRTILILTADHGEAFGEHGHYGHASSLFDEQIRVPLVLRVPDGLRHRVGGGPERRTSPVQIVDLSATVLDLLELPASSDPLSVSRSLLGTVPAAPAPVRSFLGGHQQAILDARYKLLIDHEGPPRLFDVVVDPEEEHDIASGRLDLVRGLKADAWKGTAAERRPTIRDVDEETRSQLKRLGYGE